MTKRHVNMLTNIRGPFPSQASRQSHLYPQNSCAILKARHNWFPYWTLSTFRIYVHLPPKHVQGHLIFQKTDTKCVQRITQKQL